jgi:hypothetical protein
LIVLAILAALAGVAALAMRQAAHRAIDDPWMAVAAARRRAMNIGVETTIVVMHDGIPLHVALYPDGRALADAPLPLNPLTGRRISAQR